MIWFTLGILTGALLMLGWQNKPHRKPKTARLPDMDGQRYGHPHPPLSWLKKNLPDAPANYFWELRVIHDDQGTPFLHVSMLDATSAEVVATTKRDLTNSEYRTYAHQYRAYSMIRGSIFKNDLMGPLLDWAERQVNQFGSANAVGEYTVES